MVARDDYSVFAGQTESRVNSILERMSSTVHLSGLTQLVYPVCEREWKKEVPKLSNPRDVYGALTDHCVILQAYADSNISMLVHDTFLSVIYKYFIFIQNISAIEREPVKL